MYTFRLACLLGFASLILGEHFPGLYPRLAVRQYGFGRWGIPSGTISAGTTSALYGNSTTSSSGTAYSSGSVTYSYSKPNITGTTVSGKPTVSSNTTATTSISGYPISSPSYGTISASPIPIINTTISGYSSSTHGPYPFPTSKKHHHPSGTIGKITSQSVTGIRNSTSATAPTDPSASRTYPTHGPYPFPSSHKPHTYPTSSVVGTSGGTAISTPYPSSSFSITANTMTFLPHSGTSTGPIGTGTGTGIGTGYPFSISNSDSTLGTSSKFTHTHTVKSQPSEYYYHHRRPNGGKEDYGGERYGYSFN